jgi:hypothetical protein
MDKLHLRHRQFAGGMGPVHEPGAVGAAACGGGTDLRP